MIRKSILITLCTVSTILLVSCTNSTSPNIEESLELYAGLETISEASNTVVTVNRGSDETTDGYFNISVDKVDANPLLAPGKHQAWCLEWKKNLRSSGDTHEGVSWYSSGNNEKWKPLNYFFSIRRELQAEDPELTYREIQAVVWVLAGEMGIAPEFDTYMPVGQLPSRLKSNGEANFSRDKVAAIAAYVLKQAPEASVPYSGVIARTASDQQDMFVDDDGFRLAANGVTVVCPTASPGDTGLVNGVQYEAVDNDLLRTRREERSDLTVLCTTPVTHLRNILKISRGSSSFNQDIGNWDTSNVSNMEGLFKSFINFNQDIGNWDVSSVIDMKEMFYGAVSFNQDIGSWDVSSVIDMKMMFTEAETFNQDIGNWDIRNVINMRGMFSQAESFNQDIGDWNTNKVKDMFSMFYQSDSFNQDIGAWDVSQVLFMNYMFFGADSFNRDISEWDVSQVLNMNYMFFGTSSFNQNLSGWCVENISTEPNGFDEGAINWTLPRPNWGVSCS